MKIPFLLGIVIIVVTAFIYGYVLGQSTQKVQYISKEIENVKKVAQKKAAIYSRPNIDRDTILKRMRENKL
ncbi:MAG: hypothetical protein IJ545_02115 [Alphaproteobacteria bacterium]|nr:hypothetical protein [Alphaproteobacteria bacterium]